MQRDPILEYIKVFFRFFYFMFVMAARGIQTVFRLLFWGKKTAKVLKAATSKELICKNGCPPVPADGTWTCLSCKANRIGWVWKECPVCNVKPAYIACQSCGIAIVSPYK